MRVLIGFVFVSLVALAILLDNHDSYEGWLKAHEYTLKEDLGYVPEPTIGPTHCRIGYSGKEFKAVRYPVPEERCGSEVSVKVLVCCRSDGNCYGREKVRRCAGPIRNR